LVQLNANFLVILIKRLIETISPSINNYYLDLIIIIKFFFQCDRVFPRSSSCLLMSYTIITELVLTNIKWIRSQWKKNLLFRYTFEKNSAQ